MLSSTMPASTVSSLRTNKKSYGQPISLFFDRMAVEQQADLETQFARAIYHSGAPLSMFNLTYWTTFFNNLRPKFQIPSPYALSAPLLNVEYKHVMNSIKQKINNASCLALLTDGWTNITGDGIINFIITKPEPVFYKSIVPGTNQETAEFIKDQIASVLNEIGAAKFLLICTDNASAMKSAWVKIKEVEEFKHIFFVGCLAHGLNLLHKNICPLPLLNKLILQARSIVKHVNNTHVVFSIFKTKQSQLYGRSSITLKLFSNTRWAGSVIMMKSLLKNKQSLKETAVAPELTRIIDKNVQKNILDEDIFWVRINRTLSILSPI